MIGVIFKKIERLRIHMERVVHAKIKDGIIYPDEKLDLEDKEVLVKIISKEESPFKTKIIVSQELVDKILEEEWDLLL